MSEKIQKKKVMEPEEYIYHLECEIAELKAERKIMLDSSVKAYKELSALWDCLYGQNMSVVGWHLNGDHEPIDSFFESNCENAVEELKSIIERITGLKIEEVLKCQN